MNVESISDTPTRPLALPTVLVVDDEPNLLELINDAFQRSLPCRTVVARNLREARRVLATRSIDLLITDVNLPDGDGSTLIGDLRRRRPLSSAIVMTGAPSIEGTISAMRSGAVDFFPKPFTVDDLLDRLREAVKRLNEARRQVTRKVDLLCNDLVSAYADLSRQLDDVRLTESFRKTCGVAADLEQLLCHAMDWMLRQMGYCNVAVWLAADDEFQLGAYMKYTIPGDGELADAMRDGIVRLVNRDQIVHLADATTTRLSELERKHLKGQTILGGSCTYLGETLATVVLFREEAKPFTPDDAQALRAITPVFAVALASIVKASQASETDGTPFRGDGEDSNTDNGRPDDKADWWKRGEAPPF
jgi:DNA-binding response OmpR family regulator